MIKLKDLLEKKRYPAVEPQKGVKIYGSIDGNEAKLESIEIKSSLQGQGLGKKYDQAGTIAAHGGLDPHDDNKWERRAENWAKREVKKWLDKF